MLFSNSVAALAAFAITGVSAGIRIPKLWPCWPVCPSPPDPCDAVTNQVQNGGFDSPLSGLPWVFTGMQITKNKPRSSPQAALSNIQTTVQKNSMIQSVTLEKGKTYTLRYYWAIVSGTIATNQDCYISAGVDQTNLNSLLLTATPQGTYNQHDFTFKAPAVSTLQFIVYCNKLPAPLSVNVDDVSIYEKVKGCDIPE
ncbi:unnamed protein product [Clonostachys rosea]|uniref:CBM-cenC domain-containing protein n=1 Tax=Bionectria ochroleuca TaxID=29856 RepID=A0ABY6UN30_BIOOC|nr:unnamed protein product [Clonostachys rosea]